MYKEPIFLEPEFKERIWGGTKLKEIFGYEIPSTETGEAWCISGHENGPNVIKNGALKGKTLKQAWDEHRELFAEEEGEEFPLLVKILDSKKNLSVQVHPDDTYAKKVENQNYGKTECWYVIDCEEGAEIIFGHNAANEQELSAMVENGKWEELLRKVSVKPGDFFYVPSGTIHAIGAGIQILETQQSSDITYRVYDYDRIGSDGQKRELHLEKSLEVTTVPHRDPELHLEDRLEAGLRIRHLIEEKYFSVEHWDLDGTSNPIDPAAYQLISILSGDGKVLVGDASYNISKGDHFIIPATMEAYQLKGKAAMIVSRSNKA